MAVTEIMQLEGDLSWLDADDKKRLSALCELYCRGPKDQIRFLIKEKAQDRAMSF